MYEIHSSAGCCVDKPFKGKIQEFYHDWLANGKHEYTDTGNMKPVPRRLIVEWVTKSWQAISNETVAKSTKSCGLASAVDGTKDDLISYFKEGKKCAEERALLQTQKLNLNDGNLHENPFEISGEDMAAAAPSFNIIEEDVDDDYYIDLEIIYKQYYIFKKRKKYKNLINASLF